MLRTERIFSQTHEVGRLPNQRSENEREKSTNNEPKFCTSCSILDFQKQKTVQKEIMQCGSDSVAVGAGYIWIVSFGERYLGLELPDFPVLET